MLGKQRGENPRTVAEKILAHLDVGSLCQPPTVAGAGFINFTLRSDGRDVKIDYFAAGAERVALLFALDSSGSTRDILAGQREAARELFARFGHGSRASVLYFGETVKVIAPFTTDPEAISSAFNSTSSDERRTAIYDAAAAALRSFDSLRSDPAERRIVILLSDGLDNASATRASAVIKEARERGVSFYVIHLPLYEARDGRLMPRAAAKGFREMAEQTGGKYFFLGDASSALNPQASYNLAPVFTAIEEDLRGQYILGFYPTEDARDGRPHKIEMDLTNRSQKRFRIQALRQEYILR